MVSAKFYDGRLAVDIAGLKMQTPVTTASGTFGFGLEFTDFLDLEKKLVPFALKAQRFCRAKAIKASVLLKHLPACLTA